MKDIKIKYDSTFGTIHSRDYYKGKSFHYAGQWTPGAHYFSDDYNVDFIVKDNCLLACARSHFSTVDNEPKDIILDSDGVPTTCENKGSYDQVFYCAVCKKELERNKSSIDYKA